MEIVRQYLERTSGSGKRSTVLSTLIVMGGVLLTGLVGSLWAGAAEWLLRWLVFMIVGDGALFGIAFVYFMFKNPDALRSESFELEKMAIERGLYGDSLQGVFSHEDGPRPPAVSVDPKTQIEGSK